MLKSERVRGCVSEYRRWRKGGRDDEVIGDQSGGGRRVTSRCRHDPRDWDPGTRRNKDDRPRDLKKQHLNHESINE